MISYSNFNSLVSNFQVFISVAHSVPSVNLSDFQ
jgi:hypothetical protein